MFANFVRRLKQVPLIFSPPPNMRRRHERFPVDVSIEVQDRNHQYQRQALDASDGGAFLVPALDGYVGQHIFLSHGELMTGVEARIVGQRANGTGIQFISRNHGALFAAWLRQCHDTGTGLPD